MFDEMSDPALFVLFIPRSNIHPNAGGHGMKVWNPFGQDSKRRWGGPFSDTNFFLSLVENNLPQSTQRSQAPQPKPLFNHEGHEEHEAKNRILPS